MTDAVKRWWESLDDDAREALRALDDPRRDDVALAWDEERGAFEALPIEVVGRFVDPEDARDDALARQQLLEYVNAHPELEFFLRERRFHICRAHAAARSVLRSGVIPAGFECPLRERSCPFERALAQGEGSVTLALRAKPPPARVPDAME
ncbi:MAG: hypothetical protein RLO52_20355 [Sandaracinaceae bacterium]